MALNDCWNQIGVMGDRTCGELKTVTHCHNCSVYSAAGRSLLERDAPDAYLQEWTTVLAEIPTEQSSVGSRALVRATDTLSIMIFRLGNERFALPVRFLLEVTTPCVIHSVPHRSNNLFLGLVNIRGETLLCVSLSNLLGADTVIDINPTDSKRMVVAGKDGNRWVFPVDEVHGIYRFHTKEFSDIPVVISKASEAFTKGVVTWQNQKVNCLDTESLFYSLDRKIF